MWGIIDLVSCGTIERSKKTVSTGIKKALNQMEKKYKNNKRKANQRIQTGQID